jgi:hypothetical protein
MTMSSVAEFAYLIRKHWTKYLPAKVKALRASGELEESIQGAAKLAQDLVDHLVQKEHYRVYEAEEVARDRFVYLKPEEGAGQPAWEKAELAQKDREYQRNPPVILDTDESLDIAMPSEQRREVLWELRSELLALSVHAMDGAALIGLGEAINSLDVLSEGGRVDVSVEVSIGLRSIRSRGEERYACVEVGEKGVRLSTRSSGAGTVNYSLDRWDFSRWRRTLEEIINLGGRTLTVSRNHLL